MIKNYLKTAWRNVVKNKTFSLINLAGLSLGMAACMLILQYTSFELSYDQFNKNAADIYRVVNDRYQNGKLVQHGTITYSAIGKALADDFPEVTSHTRVEPYGKVIVSANNKKIADQNILAVDNSFLDMFSYPLVAGNVKSALINPYTAILSESSARRFFVIAGNDFSEVIGQTFFSGLDSVPYKITGVCTDVPENSHLKFDILASYTSVYSGKNPYKTADYDFTDSDFWHYIQLRHGTDFRLLNAKLAAFSQRHFQGNKVSGSVEKFYLQPLGRAHLYSDFEYEIGDTASSTTVWGLLIIAALIIMIAWVNYINLTTARSMKRAKEVGVRKVSGATRSQLVKQFFTESLILNGIALGLSLLIVALLQNSFNDLVKHRLSLFYLFEKGLQGYYIVISIATIFAVGAFISGFYPAFILSSFEPVSVLKGSFLKSARTSFLRKSLVVVQFAIAVTLIIGSSVVYKQMKFVNNQKLGMNISQILIIKPPQLTNFDSTFITTENDFTNELKSITGVRGASTSSRVPGDEMGRAFDVHLKNANNSEHYTFRNMGAGEGFTSLYDMTMRAGRSFSSADYNYDYGKLHTVIINEAAVRQLGLSSDQDALGKSLSAFGSNWDIIGIINDFHQKSLHHPLEPTAILPTMGSTNPVSVKLDTKNLAQALAAIKEKYDRFFPGNIFDYYFLDEKFSQQYADDQLFGKVFGIFAGFAIFIACLGLFGLSLFATAQRTKEIGVRKVLGASVANIVALLSRDFIRLVMVAFMIAAPIAWYIMNNWLTGFAYRTPMGWELFAVAGMAAIMIALVTVSSQAIKAAVSNPVNSLRAE